jgi:hypothetical protein
MTALDPMLCERLLSEARELVRLTTPPYPGTAAERTERLGAVNVAIERYAVMADQLEAALTEAANARQVVESAVRWRTAQCQRGPDCGDGYTVHDQGCETETSMRDLVSAVDTYRAAR